MKIHYEKHLKVFAKELRNNSTKSLSLVCVPTNRYVAPYSRKRRDFTHSNNVYLRWNTGRHSGLSGDEAGEKGRDFRIDNQCRLVK